MSQQKDYEPTITNMVGVPGASEKYNNRRIIFLLIFIVMFSIMALVIERTRAQSDECATVLLSHFIKGTQFNLYDGSWPNMPDELHNIEYTLLTNPDGKTGWRIYKYKNKNYAWMMKDINDIHSSCGVMIVW
jgi:hypothetical protein